MNKSNPIISFIIEHWPLAVAAITLGALYLFGAEFAEFKYGALRLVLVVLVAFLIIQLVFKTTVRPYLHSGDFSNDFKALDSKNKVWLTLAVIGFVLFIATECFVHATNPDYSTIQTQRWTSAQIRPEKVHFVNATVAQIVRNRTRYELVSDETNVPWFVIAAIHNMECSLSFRENLANGDSLVARTRNVPKGRIPNKKPPFNWEDAAIDALKLDHLDRELWGKIGSTLQNIEAYNGTGYEKFHTTTPTPYLWCWTNLYVRGKYVSDGRWDEYAISQQCGVVPILLLLPNTI